MPKIKYQDFKVVAESESAKKSGCGKGTSRPKINRNLVLDDTLRHLYIAIRNKGALLLAVKFIHRGKKWEADTPAEAIRLRRQLEEWDQEDAEQGEGESWQQIVRSESPWTPDTFWNFVQSLGSQQKKAVVALLEKRSLRSHDLSKAIGIEESALGGVLSGLSKQLKPFELRTSDLYQVHTDWSANERKRFFYLQPAFKLAAEEVGWPEEGKKKDDATTTNSKRKH
jgi:hypothetical protein